MKLFLRWVDFINEHTATVFSFAIIPLTLFTAYEVVMRYVFKHPTIWAWDINIQLFGLIIMMGGGYNLLKGYHVKVDILVNQFSKKIQKIIDVFTAGLFIFAVGTLMYLTGGAAIESVASFEEYTSLFQPPIWPFKVMLFLASVLLFLQGIANLIRNIKFIVHPVEEKPVEKSTGETIL